MSNERVKSGLLGVLPDGWSAERLGRIGLFLRGSGDSKQDEVDDGLPCVRYGDLYTHHDCRITDTRSRISPDRVDSYTPLRYGDVLFASSGETVDDIGRSAVNLIRERAYCGGDVIILRPAIEINSSFLGHVADCASSRIQKSRLGRGSTVIHIYDEELRDLVIPVPPLEEQRRIAEILDTIDETIQATERVIAKLWSERVGAVEEQLATIDMQHPHRPLLDNVLLPSGQIDPRVEPYASLNLVGPDHILGDGRGQLIARVSAKAQGAISGKYQFEAGSVVYSKIRPELRKAWLATFDGLCSADMYPLSPTPELLGGYLASVILGQRFSRFAASVSARSSGMPKLNRRELAEFKIAVPRLEVQQVLARLVESYMRRIDAETAILEKMIEVRKGLAADLLSGRVRTVA